jgi:uncharacterized membrane protein (DUF485 family)
MIEGVWIVGYRQRADLSAKGFTMAEPDEVKFACIGCGTYNPTAAEVCEGCGHRFAGPDLVPKVRIVLPPRASENPYEAPFAAIAPPRTFQIGTLVAWIAVLAVCMGAFRENIALGIFTTLSFLPPTFRTSAMARHRRAQGRSMALEERFATFVITMFATWAIVFACAISFCVTCLASGSVSQNFGLGLFVGVIGAALCGVWLTRVFVKTSRENARREREIRYRNH